MNGVTLRRVEPADVAAAGDLCFVAFHDVALRHGQVPIWANPAVARAHLETLRGLDPAGGIVCEWAGRPIGVAWVRARGSVATLGPLAVEPAAQGRGVGRRLIEEALTHVGRHAPQVRVATEALPGTSSAPFLRLGFRIVCPLLELRLDPERTLRAPATPAGVVLRAPASADRPRIIERDARAFGGQRAGDVDLMLGQGRSLVAERGEGRLAGHALAGVLGGVARIGPAFADDAEVVLAMVGALAGPLAGEGHAVHVLAVGTDRRVVEGLLEAGFRVLRAGHYLVRGGGTAPPVGYLLASGELL
jgi:GNAT superfamily N-acetyltransferase